MNAQEFEAALKLMGLVGMNAATVKAVMKNADPVCNTNRNAHSKAADLLAHVRASHARTTL